jgi:hypothetical protein
MEFEVNMATKIVNGEEVELSAEEEAEMRAEWSAADAARATYVATEQYKDLRRDAYPSIEEIAVALWEKIIENRPESADALQTIREAVKEDYPKPQSVN